MHIQKVHIKGWPLFGTRYSIMLPLRDEVVTSTIDVRCYIHVTYVLYTVLNLLHIIFEEQ